MSNLVAPEPEHCPGTQSEEAGKASACQGCPNQTICAESVPKGPDPDIAVIAERLSNVKHKFLVLSGKGGVGKWRRNVQKSSKSSCCSCPPPAAEYAKVV